MNQDQTNGVWEQLKGKSKKVWGGLTDDDFLMAKGSAEALYGVIQKKFGDTKEVIKSKLDQLTLP